MLKQYVTYNNNRTANIFYIYLTYKLCILYNLSQEEIAFLVREAQYHNLTVIPLVQTFGHLEVSIKTFTNNSSKTICCLLEWEINLYKKYTNHNLIKSTLRVCCSSPRLTLRSFFYQFVLKHNKFAHLRETTKYTNSVCPKNPGKRGAPPDTWLCWQLLQHRSN